MEKASQILNCKLKVNPNQMKWSPFEFDSLGVTNANFVDGLRKLAGAGDERSRHGLNIYMYLANKNMDQTAMQNSDGDFLIVPQAGALRIRTEFGRISVKPGEIVVIQQGMRFSIDLQLKDIKFSRGYVLEIFDGHFQLPDLGPIGANGLADPRHFLTPTAFAETQKVEFEIVIKFQGSLFNCKQKFNPFNVVAWHGNYVPYKYDLSKFMVINTVSFDHCVRISFF